MMLLANINAPNIGVQHKEDNTSAFIDGRNAGNGTLYITENQVSWLTAAGQGFDLEYPKICLHAISRDLNSFQHECLYLQVEGKLFDMFKPVPMREWVKIIQSVNSVTSRYMLAVLLPYDFKTDLGKKMKDESEEPENSDEDDDSPVTEVRFVPTDKQALDMMFIAMSDCQTLHPDPDDVDSDAGEEEGEGDGWYQGEEGESELTPQGRATLQHLENLLHAGQGDSNTNTQPANGNIEAMEDEEGQFDDADMEQ